MDDGDPPEPRGLTDRLDAVKRVSQAKTMLSAAQEKSPEAYAAALAKEVLEKHRSGQTTLVVVNTVARAQAVYRALVKAGRDQGGLLLLHSRLRPPDRAHLVERLRREGEADRIIVATQAVEAGVDITSAVLFTELAPWSSLVQRFGRCNRRGELNDTGGAEICWVDLEQAETFARPYAIEPVNAARQIVTRLTDGAPRRLSPALSPPETKQVIRAGDFEQLFDTDSDLSGYDLDVSPYIRDTDETALIISAHLVPTTIYRPRGFWVMPPSGPGAVASSASTGSGPNLDGIGSDAGCI
ncbi:MAG: CRISPR-associated helicase Cas3' [Thiohalocapsa sp.]